MKKVVKYCIKMIKRGLLIILNIIIHEYMKKHRFLIKISSEEESKLHYFDHA